MIFLLLSLASFLLVSSSAAGSRRLTNASPPIVIGDDVIRMICSYLPYRDQRKSFFKINKRSYEMVHDLNAQTIQRSIDSKNQLTSLLREPASVPRIADIFNLRRRMMLDEQHAFQWIDARKQFGRRIRKHHETVLGGICEHEFSGIDHESGKQYRKTVRSLQRAYPRYQLPYNLAQFKALREEYKDLINYSRKITSTLYDRSVYEGDYESLLSTIYYLFQWEVLYSLNLLPRRIDVYDDEAIHCDSTQMRELRRLIAECGLMVIHPKDIAAAVNPNQSGVAAMLLRDPPIARIQEGGMSRHELCAQWILDVFNKMEPQQWNSLLQNHDDIPLICDMYDSALRAGDDDVAQSAAKDRFKQWFGGMPHPEHLWEMLDERRRSAEQKEKDKMDPK